MAITAYGKATDFERFVIGQVGNEKFWTNPALDHTNGRLMNERLMMMNDEQLHELSHSKDLKTCYTETYQRPKDKTIAENQGGVPGETYDACHRATIILQFREASKKAKSGQDDISSSAEQISRIEFNRAQWEETRRQFGSRKMVDVEHEVEEDKELEKFEE